MCFFRDSFDANSLEQRLQENAVFEVEGCGCGMWVVFDVEGCGFGMWVVFDVEGCGCGLWVVLGFSSVSLGFSFSSQYFFRTGSFRHTDT